MTNDNKLNLAYMIQTVHLNEDIKNQMQMLLNFCEKNGKKVS